MSTVVRPSDVEGPPPPSGRSRPSLVLALVIVVLLAGAGAAVVVTRGGSSPEPSEDVVTQAEPRTDEEKIVEAVKNYYRVDDEAFEGAHGPDPNHPLYPVYAAGPQLQTAVDAARKAKEQGLAGRRPANSVSNQKITVTSIEGDRARIKVCSVDDGIIVRVDTGKPAYDYPTGFAVTALLTGEMVREGGSWKVWSLKQDQRWEGIAGCDVGQA